MSNARVSCCEIPLPMEFTESQKGNRVLTYLGFEYLYFRTLNGVVTWRCRRNRSTKCRSIMKTRDDKIVQEPTEHRHVSCPQKAEASSARSKIREDMAVVPANSRDVAGSVLSVLSSDVLELMSRQSSLAWLPMEFTESQKGNRVLAYLGFEYLYFRTLDGVVTWRCRRNRSTKCHSTMRTRNNEVVQEPTEHCHDSCLQKVEADFAKSKMREGMAVVPTTHDIMRSVLSVLSGDVLDHMPRESPRASGLLNYENKDHLSDPMAVNFAIPERYRELVLHDSGVHDPNRIIVLGDKELSLQLSEDTIFGDGTFDKVPNMFFQLYTWHAKIGNSYPPCIYVLLQKKNLDTCNRMFEIMKLLVPDLQPKKVLVGFEKATMNAAVMAFPQAEVKGCHFDLCQNLVRKLGSVGLGTEFEADVNVKLKLKSLAALAFIPINDVRSVFDKLAATFPDEDSYNELLAYFFSTYLEGVAGREPQFPIRLWNHHDAVLQRSPETTSCCKEFHDALNSLFHCSHPNIWLLFDGLQRDLAHHRLTLVKAEAGCPKAKRKKCDKVHQLIATIVQAYDQVEDKLLYLRRLADLF